MRRLHIKYLQCCTGLDKTAPEAVQVALYLKAAAFHATSSAIEDPATPSAFNRTVAGHKPTGPLPSAE